MIVQSHKHTTGTFTVSAIQMSNIPRNVVSRVVSVLFYYSQPWVLLFCCTKDCSRESWCNINHARSMDTHMRLSPPRTCLSNSARGDTDRVWGWGPTVSSNRPRFAIISLLYENSLQDGSRLKVEYCANRFLAEASVKMKHFVFVACLRRHVGKQK